MSWEPNKSEFLVSVLRNHTDPGNPQARSLFLLPHVSHTSPLCSLRSMKEGFSMQAAY